MNLVHINEYIKFDITCGQNHCEYCFLKEGCTNYKKNLWLKMEKIMKIK